jgi:hypothetical protein
MICYKVTINITVIPTRSVSTFSYFCKHFGIPKSALYLLYLNFLLNLILNKLFVYWEISVCAVRRYNIYCSITWRWLITCLVLVGSESYDPKPWFILRKSSYKQFISPHFHAAVLRRKEILRSVSYSSFIWCLGLG